MGARPPDPADHQRCSVPTVFCSRSIVRRLPPRLASVCRRSGRRALIISLLAKWAPLIRGHGIPEAMEAILTKQSRIAPRTAIAKPISAAIAIGTGAPFGAEAPSS